MPWDTENDSEQAFREPSLTVPVNGAPWQIMDCPDEGIPAPPTCELVRFLGAAEEDQELSAVTVELVGGESCGLADEDLAGSIQHHKYIRRFTPQVPLLTGETYHARCDGHILYSFAVRNDPAPASAPRLADPTVHPVDGDSCCGYGDGLELRVAEPEAAFIEEGGYIELAYSNGQRFAVNHRKRGDYFLVPPTDDTIALTPVGADGTRGDTIEVTDTNSDQACNAAVRPTPLRLWLLAPLVWICVHRRRRASSRPCGERGLAQQ